MPGAKPGHRAGFLPLAPLLVVLISAFTPYAMFVYRKYPMLEPKDARQISAGVLPKSAKTQPEWFDQIREIPLTIPINASGVRGGEVVLVDGIRLTMDIPGGTKWEPGWTGQRMILWPEGGQDQISYQIDRKMFDRDQGADGHFTH